MSLRLPIIVIATVMLAASSRPADITFVLKETPKDSFRVVVLDSVSNTARTMKTTARAGTNLMPTTWAV